MSSRPQRGLFRNYNVSEMSIDRRPKDLSMFPTPHWPSIRPARTFFVVVTQNRRYRPRNSPTESLIHGPINCYQARKILERTDRWNSPTVASNHDDRPLRLTFGLDNNNHSLPSTQISSLPASGFRTPCFQADQILFAEQASQS